MFPPSFYAFTIKEGYSDVLASVLLVLKLGKNGDNWKLLYFLSQHMSKSWREREEQISDIGKKILDK